MAVSQVATSASYVGNGSTTQFSVPFKFMAATDLVVTSTPSGGSPSTLVQGVSYSVLGAGNDAGGLITITPAPLTGTAILIRRVTSPVQPLVLGTQGAFPPVSITDALDRATLQEQETQARALGLETRMSAAEGNIQTLQTQGGGTTPSTKSLTLQDTSPAAVPGASNSSVFRTTNGILECSINGGSFVAVDLRQLSAQAFSATGVSNSLTPALVSGCLFLLSLDHDLAINNPTIGGMPAGTRIRFIFTQDSTGYRAVTWGTNWKGATVFLPRQGAGQVSHIEFVVNADGTTLTRVGLDGIDLRQAFNDADWGAPEDGTTDSTAQVQTMLTKSGTVIGGVPMGTARLSAGSLMKLTRPLEIHTSNVQFRGAGRRQSRIRQIGAYWGPSLVICPPWPGLPVRAGLTTSGGSAMSLDGSQNYFLNFNDCKNLSLNGLSAFTVEGYVHVDSDPVTTSNWVACQGKRNSGDPTNTVTMAVSFERGVDFGAYTGNAIIFQLTTVNGLVTAHTVFDLGTPFFMTSGANHFVRVTYNGANMFIFVDGVLILSKAQTGAVVQPAHQDFTIGCSTLNWPEATVDKAMFTGAIDSLRISNTCRSTSGFTPPTAKLACDSATMLLHNFDNESGVISGAYTSFSGSTQNVFLALRRNNTAGTYGISDVTVEDLWFDGTQQDAGVKIMGTVAAKVHRVAGTGGIHLLNNSFFSQVSECDLVSSGNSPVGILVGVACGDTQLFNNKVTGFQYQTVVMESGVELNELSLVPNTTTVVPLVVASAAASLNSDSVSNLGYINIDDEGASALMECGVLLSCMNSVLMQGGNLDLSTAGHDVPLVKVDQCRSVVAAGVGFAGAIGATSPVFKFINTAPTTPNVTVVGDGRYKTILAWSDTSKKVSVLSATSGHTVVRGISATDTPANNLNGTASATGATATATVTFATAEPDASFKVTSFLPTTTSGTPAAGSNRPLSISKSMSGFVVTLEAAPGGGNTVNFDWSIQR